MTRYCTTDSRGLPRWKAKIFRVLLQLPLPVYHKITDSQMAQEQV
ncbi:hypothetical protein CLOSTHATH_02048 [Hungatella hathewayi DSM 13479]|uniref:Uncharacterized protein n=1 Tax=Hungatella hathewayi DSM 13479 TaxID=566550 RepID=D3AEL4_9FIRM|nr:hypothetical protein CLOSTHATH_02048 [Hungatella hathewayi DSM 13479]